MMSTLYAACQAICAIFTLWSFSKQVGEAAHKKQGFEFVFGFVLMVLAFIAAVVSIRQL